MHIAYSVPNKRVSIKKELKECHLNEKNNKSEKSNMDNNSLIIIFPARLANTFSHLCVHQCIC